MNVDDVKALATAIREEVAKAITGQRDTVDLMLTALFAGGHILLEGPPGTAKTMRENVLSLTAVMTPPSGN